MGRRSWRAYDALEVFALDARDHAPLRRQGAGGLRGWLRNRRHRASLFLRSCRPRVAGCVSPRFPAPRATTLLLTASLGARAQRAGSPGRPSPGLPGGLVRASHASWVPPSCRASSLRHRASEMSHRCRGRTSHPCARKTWRKGTPHGGPWGVSFLNFSALFAGIETINYSIPRPRIRTPSHWSV